MRVEVVVLIVVLLRLPDCVAVDVFVAMITWLVIGHRVTPASECLRGVGHPCASHEVDKVGSLNAIVLIVLLKEDETAPVILVGLKLELFLQD
jgi:hypothetical protein